MKQPIRYILSLLVFYLIVFLLCRVAFMLYNHASYAFTLTDVFSAWSHGLALDIATSAYLIALPWLACLVAVWCPRFPLRAVLFPYFLISAIVVAFFSSADAVLYEHWQFKIDSSIYNYLNPTNNGAGESVSTLFVIGCAVVLTSYILLLIIGPTLLTPRRFTIDKRPGKATPTSRRRFATLGMVLIATLLGLSTFGGREDGKMTVGTAYYSDALFLNHAAVNPIYSLAVSTLRMGDYGQQFRYYPDAEATQIVTELYSSEPSSPHPSTINHKPSTINPQPSLLRNPRPNIVIVQLESFCSKFIGSLGGMQGVCPDIDHIASEGILFEQMYANSFRTDRGTASIQSGMPAYPTATLVKISEVHKSLPSLAQSLINTGYTTSYTYGGDLGFMNTNQYLRTMGFTHQISEPDFHLAPGERSTWGARDSLVLHCSLESLTSHQPEQCKYSEHPFFSVIQTLDSHEPFKVPYNRFADPVLNAFAYTDHCLGQFVEGLKASPLWDNLLLIIISDHGLMYDMNYEDPEFFHIPMIWTGGAITAPQRINTLMNQSDLAATLLGQLGLPHDNFTWSRDVLSPAYTNPFVYCTFPSGIMLRDATGTTIYDTNADRPIMHQPKEGGELRQRRAKAILQKSYDHLQSL